MKQGIHIAGGIWALCGLALCAWASWGLAVQEHFRSVVVSWLIALTFGVLAFVGGFLATQFHSAGRYLLVVVSILGLVYVVAYFLFGGLGDARSYVPGVIVLFALSVYTLVAYSQVNAHAT